MSTAFSDLIARAQLFEGLSLDMFEDVLAQCPVLTLSAGQVLLEPGVPNQCLYVLLDGVLNVCVARSDTEPLAQVAAGDCVGEVSLIDRRSPSAFVLAATEARVLAVSEPLLLQLMQHSHLLSLNLMRVQADHFRRNLESLQSSQRTERRYRDLAQTDALTGLYNRAWCNQVMTAQLAQCVQVGQAVSLAMLDVDHFKQVNDRHGHPAGDVVLKSVADLLRGRFRGTDALARYGGEEFMVLMPATGVQQAQEVLEQVRQALQDLPIALDSGETLRCTISIGVAQHQLGQSLNELISLADQMLYRAKQSGRNRVMARTAQQAD